MEIDIEYVKKLTSLSQLLQYLVSVYGKNVYTEKRILSNLIADLYVGEEKLKRALRRAISDDMLPQRIYELSLIPINEREACYNKIVAQFIETNFYTEEFGKKMVDDFVQGLGFNIFTISTKATDQDGKWIDEFGAVYSVDKRKLIHGPDGSRGNYEYVIRKGTVVICDSAFDHCCGLTAINIPASVTSIGDRAFVLCSGLTAINIPASVTSIGDSAFWGCTGLTAINIPDSVTSIGGHAFGDCSRLTAINIPHGTLGEFKRLLQMKYHSLLKEI